MKIKKLLKILISTTTVLLVTFFLYLYTSFNEIRFLYISSFILLIYGFVVMFYKHHKKATKIGFISNEDRNLNFILFLAMSLFVFLTIYFLGITNKLNLFPFIIQKIELYTEQEFNKVQFGINWILSYFQLFTAGLAIFALLLAFLNFKRKFGASISGDFSYLTSPQGIPYINQITLLNEKDKTSSIFSINIIFNKKYKIRLIDFKNDPLTINAYSLKIIELPPVFKYVNLKNSDVKKLFTKHNILLECLTEAGLTIVIRKKFFNDIKGVALRLPISHPNVPLDSTHLIKFHSENNPIPTKIVENHFIITNFCNNEKIKCIEKIKLPSKLIDSLNNDQDISSELKKLYREQIEIFNNGSYPHGREPELLSIEKLPLSNNFFKKTD